MLLWNDRRMRVAVGYGHIVLHRMRGCIGYIDATSAAHFQVEYLNCAIYGEAYCLSAKQETEISGRTTPKYILSPVKIAFEMPMMILFLSRISDIFVERSIADYSRSASYESIEGGVVLQFAYSRPLRIESKWYPSGLKGALI